MTTNDDPFAGFKAAQRAGWAHFAPLETLTTEPAFHLVRFAGIHAGRRVLDAACGTGVVSVTAAREGARVTALDLTPALLDAARENARVAGLAIDFHEGDVEALPFEDAAFDAVVSQFGHIFAPRPDVAIAEMLRVLKPGGVLAFSAWPPELYVGRSFALSAHYMPPPPPGVMPPFLWGDPHFVAQRLGNHVRDLKFERETMRVPTLSVQQHREMLERTVGPVIRLVETLGASDPARLEAFRRDTEALAAEYFSGNVIRQGYLMAKAIKA